MRLLTDEEMDSVFGGYDSAVTTLPTVTVTASVAPNWNIAPIAGYTDITNEVYAAVAGGGCTHCAGVSICPAIPSPDKLNCFADNYLHSGNQIPDAVDLRAVNTYAYASGDNGWGMPTYTITTSWNGLANSIYASIAYDGSSLQVYAQGFLPLSGGTMPYLTPGGDINNDPRNLNAPQNLAWQIGHEAWHYNNPGPATWTEEMMANYQGYLALQAYNANPTACNGQ